MRVSAPSFQDITEQVARHAGVLVQTDFQAAEAVGWEKINVTLDIGAGSRGIDDRQVAGLDGREGFRQINFLCADAGFVVLVDTAGWRLCRGLHQPSTKVHNQRILC